MGSVDRVDDRTFRANFSVEGVAKLRERVNDKLKEFMGDYTDDTLVEYVIVLLRNGRRKEEARNELNVFLGDDSDSFVSWLWDHLSASLDMYIQPQHSHVEEANKAKSTLRSQDENKGSVQVDSESEKGKPEKLSESRRSRQWRDLASNAVEPPPFISSEVHKIHFEEKNDHKARHERSSSPRHRSHGKRSRVDDRQHEQSEADVPRRLLQFAVRDALATSKPSNSAKEPSLKRLRSVVSTSSQESSFAEPPRRNRSIARVLNPMATVMKAVAEAAEDVRKTRPGRSVFDRISLSTDVPEFADQHAEFRDVNEPDEYEDINGQQVQKESQYPHRLDLGGGYDESMTETAMSHDIMFDDDRLDDPVIIGHRGVDVHHRSSFGANNDDNPVRAQGIVAVRADDFRRMARNENHNQAMAAATSCKMANVPGNLNPQNPPEYREQREVAYMDSQKSFPAKIAGVDEAILQSKVTNSNLSIGNGNVKPAADVQKGPLKMQISNAGTCSAIGPLEDADSRTIFVSNVHFGATKDGLSRHFNKFGDVLKVVIVTDPATGQPTGSAYVEFMHKEAADEALSLDGTSFMSRILKIVKRNSAQQDAAPTMTWSRATRGSPYSVRRFPRAPFPRAVVTGAFRGRPFVRAGARSLQWKRDAPANPADAVGSSAPGNIGSALGARSLTYVRTDPKLDGNP